MQKDIITLGDDPKEIIAILEYEPPDTEDRLLRIYEFLFNDLVVKELLNGAKK